MGKLPGSLVVLRVLRHPALLRLWLAQIIYLSAQFTASYAMIVLVTDETHSATLVGLVIIALSLPLVLLGAPAGALVDRVDRRMVLWSSNVVRALATALFVVVWQLDPHQYAWIYVLAFLFSLVGLFFSPAEGAIIPHLVGEMELLPALSLYNLTLNVSQAVGLLLLGPLALEFLPTVVVAVGAHRLIFTPVETLFAALTILYLVAAGLTASLPGVRQSEQKLPIDATGEDPPQPDVSPLPLSGTAGQVAGGWHRLQQDVQEGWQLVRVDGDLLDGVWQACFGGLVMLTIAELATTFVQRLLKLPTSDTALVFAPAGIGLVVGSLLMPLVVARLGTTRTILSGLVGTALGIGLLPLAQRLARFLDPGAWHSNPIFLLAVAGLTALVGMSLDCIIVPAQTRMQERSPDELRGRVLALYQVLFNGGAIPVMLFMGALTDLLGLEVVMNLLAASSAGMALLTAVRARRRHQHGAGSNLPGGPGQSHENRAFAPFKARSDQV